MVSSVWTASILCLINPVVKPRVLSQSHHRNHISQTDINLSVLLLRLLLHNYILLERIGKYLWQLLARRHRIQMPLTKLWLCCLLLHIPQWIASVFYLLYMHLPLLSPFSSRSILKWQLRECIVATASALFLILPHPPLNFIGAAFSKKKKKKRVVVSCSLLISLFYVFSPDAELGRVAPAIVSPDRTRYSPTLLDLASWKPMRIWARNVRIQLRGNAVLTLMWTGQQTTQIFFAAAGWLNIYVKPLLAFHPVIRISLVWVTGT